MRLSHLVSLWAATALAVVRACETDEDCSLNGICTPSCKKRDGGAVVKTCKCDHGWIGDDCGHLDLAPATRNAGYNYTYLPPDPNDIGDYKNASWGGRVLQDPKDPKLFHLFTVQFTQGCGLSGWRPHSYVIRAESRTGPQGPYHYAQEVTKPFRHNPDVIYSPADDKYLLYTIGVDDDKVYDNCNSISYEQWPNNISVASADDIRGPWTASEVVVDSDRPAGVHATNPAPLTLWTPENPTGKIVLGMKDYTIFTADSFEGPYELQYQATWDITERTSPYWTEDPFFWQDKRGNWHSVNHWLIDYVEHDGRRWPRVGAHLFARNLTGPWHFKLQEAFSSNITFTDGSWHLFNRRERPKIFFSDDGNMTPLYMVNGVQDYQAPGGASYTFIQPIGTKWKEYEESLGF